jgi:DNA-binding response OmpR family regulator
MTHKILIADDEPNILISLEYLMKREGYLVLRARDGGEALALIARERPDLVLLDVMMPGKSGFDVCQAVRADETLSGVKIVLLTAKGRDTDFAKGMALGATDYLTKPFSTKELAARVRALLQPPECSQLDSARAGELTRSDGSGGTIT